MITFTPNIENILPSVTPPIYGNLVTVGHRDSGHVLGQHCQFLCDGTDDSEVINQALKVTTTDNDDNSFIVLLPGHYILKSTVEIDRRGLIGLDKHTTVLHIDLDSIDSPGIKISHPSIQNNSSMVLLANLSIINSNQNVLIEVKNLFLDRYINIRMKDLIVSSVGIICKCGYRTYIDCSDCDLRSERNRLIFDLGWWPTGKIYHNRLFRLYSHRIIRIEDVQRIYICNNVLDEEISDSPFYSFIGMENNTSVNDKVYVRNNGRDILPPLELTTSGWKNLGSYKEKKMTVPGVTSNDDLLISVDKPTVEKMREFNKISYTNNHFNELVFVCEGDVPAIPLTLKIKRL